jgi:hypothetical protein
MRVLWRRATRTRDCDNSMNHDVMEEVELWGGPHDGQEVTIRKYQNEIRMPCPASIAVEFTEQGTPKPVQSIVYAVYRRRGWRYGKPVFKWYGNGDV